MSSDSDAKQGLELVDRVCLGNPKQLDGRSLLAFATRDRRSTKEEQPQRKTKKKKTASNQGKKKRHQPSLYEQYYSGTDDSENEGDAAFMEEAAQVTADDAKSRYSRKSYASVAMSSSTAASSAPPPRTTGLVEMSEVSDRALSTIPFEVGMDVNILVQQLLTNAINTLYLEDEENTGRFGDHELICVAAAVAHNSSLSSIQLRWLQVTDTSLVPFYKNLERHPNLHSLDLCGTRGAEASSRALRKLVCSNSNILHVMTDDTRKTKWRIEDDEVIELATRYNALVCPGISNPYDKKVITTLFDKKEEDQLLERQLQMRLENPFVQHTVNPGDRQILLGGTVISPPPAPLVDSSTAASSGSNMNKKKKSVQFVSGSAAVSAKEAEIEEAKRSAAAKGALCRDFMLGTCRFGSRCYYQHPERTITTTQQAERVRHEQQQQALREEAAAIAAMEQVDATGMRRRGEGEVDDVLDAWLLDAAAEFGWPEDDDANGGGPYRRAVRGDDDEYDDAADGNDDAVTLRSHKSAASSSRRLRGVLTDRRGFTLVLKKNNTHEQPKNEAASNVASGDCSVTARRWTLSDRDVTLITAALCVCSVALAASA